ncbi:MAG: hypothetical protein M1479_03865 [Actinobacteria bacterium]|nr:hypothetical protein [Actinomycetota bacterium]
MQRQFCLKDTYYEYKHRFETYGISGLEDRPRKTAKMPNEAKKETAEKILEFAGRYPSYGASRIACELGNIVCGATVHNILKKHGLSKKFDWLKKVYWKEGVIWSPGYFVSTIGINEKEIISYVRWRQSQDLGQAKLEF